MGFLQRWQQQHLQDPCLQLKFPGISEAVMEKRVHVLYSIIHDLCSYPVNVIVPPTCWCYRVCFLSFTFRLFCVWTFGCGFWFQLVWFVRHTKQMLRWNSIPPQHCLFQLSMCLGGSTTVNWWLSNSLVQWVCFQVGRFPRCEPFPSQSQHLRATVCCSMWCLRMLAVRVFSQPLFYEVAL